MKSETYEGYEDKHLGSQNRFQCQNYGVLLVAHIDKQKMCKFM